jgi:hypothetical protein
MRTPLVARISTTALVEGSMLKASNVRSGMRLTEAGQFDAMRSTCDHTTASETQKQPVFPRDSKRGDQTAPAASSGKRHH